MWQAGVKSSRNRKIPGRKQNHPLKKEGTEKVPEALCGGSGRELREIRGEVPFLYKSGAERKGGEPRAWKGESGLVSTSLSIE